MAAQASGRLLAFEVNSGSVGSASVGGVVAAWGGSATGRQSEQSVVCVGHWSGPSSSATHWVLPLLLQTSVMPWGDGIGNEKTMLQLNTRQSRTHRCRARVGLVKFAMRGLYVRIHSRKMNI